MTIEEAIKHCEEVAEEKESEAQNLEYSKLDWRYEANQCSECASDHRQFVEWLKELKQLREQTKWIPCSDRCPEEDGQYLITVKYEHVNDYEDIYSEHGEWNDGKWDMSLFGHCGKVERITAWMPLPKPYKAESEDKE